MDLSAYRIVQEALTNAARHAGPTTVHVTLDHGPHLLAITVRDDGPRPGSPSGALLSDGPNRAGTGHGLIGIRERAALFNGTCRAGPLGAGFEVHVTLEIDDVPQTAGPGELRVPTEAAP